MREKKFRGWDKEKKKMFYFDFESIADAAFHDDWDLIYLDYYMDYTGLKDKNVKEIYEEDIVMWDGNAYRIRDLNGEWILFHPGDPEYDRPSLYSIVSPKQSGIEIIGNIYEDPDLLY